MIKKACLLVLAMIFCLGGLACGQGPSPTPAATAIKEPTKSPVSTITKAATQTPAKAAWELQWDKAVAEAKKEGKVVIYSNGGSDVRAALTSAAKDKLGIDLEWVMGGGPELAPKMFAERRAGLYLVDMWLIGGSVPVADLKPQGVLDPISPMMLLPEVTDPKVWFGGKPTYADKEEKYVLSSTLYPAMPLIINTEQLKPADVKSYKSLLEPRFKEKIAMGDPTKPGAAGRMFGVLARKIMNPDYLRALAKQEPVILGNERQLVEWVAKGKYPVGIGMRRDPVAEFMKARAPIDWMIPAEGTHMVGGVGLICVVNKLPHPNATTVFLNWFLSKEGQTLYSRTNLTQSARIDTPTDHLTPESMRQAGVNYFFSETEDFLMTESENFKLTKEIFGPLMK